ncbi:MAG: hypothetical protein OXE92_08290 [Bacteroidetes bacterium]|nr:hypothetical protein [Bacteroidota bacterium]
MKISYFATKFSLIIALAVTGYLVGATMVAITTNAAEERDCENDICQHISHSHYIAACIDAPDEESGCDAKFSWLWGKHYCETTDCDSEE